MADTLGKPLQHRTRDNISHVYEAWTSLCNFLLSHQVDESRWCRHPNPIDLLRRLHATTTGGSPIVRERSMTVVLPAVRGLGFTTCSVTLTLPGGEDRDEPVQLTVKADAGQHPAATGLEHAAAEVVQGNVRDPRGQAAGDPRGKLAALEGVVALSLQPETRSTPHSASPDNCKSARLFRCFGGMDGPE